MATLTHSHPKYHPPGKKFGAFDILFLLRYWVDGIQVKNTRFAHFICRFIPCKCPFERDVHVFQHSFHIPGLCKINPLYNELVALRFRALSFLCDECGEDVNQYIC